MIQSISRALDLLELLKRPQRTFSIAQLSSDIGLPPSTVHRLLQTLCEKGFVYRDEQTHLYQLGPALISLGTAAAQGQDLRQLATPVLQRLAQQALEDAFHSFRLSRVGSLPGGRPQQSARDREVRL